MQVELLAWRDSRWKVRVSLPPGIVAMGLTVGFVGEDGVALGPAVVAPEGCLASVEVEVRGPCRLPPGAIARVVVHGAGGEATTHEIVLALRAGLHAWLKADSRMAVISRAQPRSLSAGESRTLGDRWCWLGPSNVSAPGEVCGCERVPDDLRSMLSEFGVDADELSEEVAASLRGR